MATETVKITNENVAEWERLASYHSHVAGKYAERSFEFAGEISDGFSAASEAHRLLSNAFKARADAARGLETTKG